MKATLYIASSLNGKITRGQTDSDWVSEKDGEMFDVVCKEHGCILVGANSYNQYEDEIYPIENTKNIVLTHENKSSNNPDVFFKNNLDDAIDEIKNLGFDRFLIAGGANVIGQCLERKLVDQLYLSLHPYLFGKGLNVMGDYAGDLNLLFQGVKREDDEFILLDYKVES